MTKFMVLYSSTASASQLMANASPEQMKTSMSEWIKWRDDASKVAKVDFGMPLQAVSHITTKGTTDSISHVSGYSIVEGDSKGAIVELLRSHPHLTRLGASIDLLEMLAMPGME